MSTRFPIRRKTDATAEIGLNVVAKIVNDDLGWIFRRTHEEHDYGVDGYIDYVTPDGGVTGRFIAVQIKTGESYLSKNHDVHWYRDTREHLNYFLNIPVPVLLIICDPKSRCCYWQELRKENVEFTGENWRFPVPKRQEFNSNIKKTLVPIFGEGNNHVALLEEEASLLEFISKNSLIQYSVPRDDVENCNIRKLREFINRITNSESLVRAAQGKLCITIAGYEADSRELFQIRDVRRWAKRARKKITEWYLCTNTIPKFSTLTWMASCTCEVNAELKERPNGEMIYRVNFNSEDLTEYLEECFEGLNEATEKWMLGDEFNNHVSKKITQELLPEFHSD